MSGFEPLFDDAAPVRRAPLRDSSDFLRSSPALTPTIEHSPAQAESDPTGQRELGQAALSLRRHESAGAQAWMPGAQEGGVIGADPVADTGFLKRHAEAGMVARTAGQSLGNRAEAYRAHFGKEVAGIRRRRAGGFLNYNNWGWVRRRRENQLRTRLKQQYFPAGGVELPSHRTRLAGKGLLKPGDARIHDEKSLHPATRQANAEYEQAFEEESAASTPFSRGGALVGRMDVKFHDKKAQIQGGNDSASAFNSNVLFGVTSGAPADVSADDQAKAETYRQAMDAGFGAESYRRYAASHQTHMDQGDLKAQPFFDNERNFRTAYHNAYWNSEKLNPVPTRKAKHDRRVRFNDDVRDDDGDAPTPMESRAPDRRFAVRHEAERASKATRRETLASKLDEFKKKNSAVWDQVGTFGHSDHLEQARKAQGFAPAEPSVGSDIAPNESLIREESDDE